MSSRSLAAARAKRTGEKPPPISGTRPITSIQSQAAFVQQMPGNGMYPPQPSNVRVAGNQPVYRQPIQNARQQQQPQQPPQQQMYYQQQNKPVVNEQIEMGGSNGLPFQKLSVSDAIGLITLRLGKVEQWIIDHENNENTDTPTTQTSKPISAPIPENHKLIDNAVLNSIINRLTALEKNALEPNKSAEMIKNKIQNDMKNDVVEQIKSLQEQLETLKHLIQKKAYDNNDLETDFNSLKEQLEQVNATVVKHSASISSCEEQIYQFNRDFITNKDNLKEFMMKYDLFTDQTEKNFNDYELALVELEKRMISETKDDTNEEIHDDTPKDKDNNNDDNNDTEKVPQQNETEPILEAVQPSETNQPEQPEEQERVIETNTDDTTTALQGETTQTAQTTTSPTVETTHIPKTKKKGNGYVVQLE